MIIGRGDIAALLKDDQNRLYFASGVSNSLETLEAEFKREKDLLSKQDKRKHLVYFSSLAIFYEDTPYTKHKKAMEALVKTFAKYTIVRLGTITWGKNPNRLINCIRRRAQAGQAYAIPQGYRYVVTKDEFLHWMNLIPVWSCEMNITGELMTIKQVVEKYANTPYEY